MALDCGPDRTVRTPGAMASEESSEVAKVRVTNGLSLCWLSGRYGSRKGRCAGGNDSGSLDIVLVL